MTSTLLTFDGGVPGASVVAGANDIDAILDGAPVFAAGLHGAAAVRAGASSNTADSRFRVALGLSGDHSGSTYLRCNTAHGSGSASVNFFHITSSTNSFLVQFRAGPNNALNIRVGTTNVRTGSSNEIPIGSWFRLDWQLVGTAMNWRVYYNRTSDGTPSLSGSVTVDTFTATKLILGAQSTSAIFKDWSFDTVRIDSSGAWLGAFPEPPPASGFTVLNGSTELAATATIWNGTAEVAIGSWAIA